MNRISSLLFIVVLSAVCFGCAGVSEKFKWDDGSVDLKWPQPPDVPRVSYLRSLHGEKDFKSAEDGRFLRWLLGEQNVTLPLLSPFAVAVTREGVVWVADTGARALFRIDSERKTVDMFKAFSDYSLVSPSGLAVDEESGRVYLSDAENKVVFILDQEGRYLDSIRPDEGFRRPAGLAVNSSGKLLVADAMGGVVYVFDKGGNVSSEIYSKVNPDGRFHRPLNLAVGPGGEVLILDAMSFRVEVQTADGQLLGTIGKLGDSAGFLARPKGLSVDRFGHVFISDAAFDNIQVFDLAGNLLMYFGGTGNGPGQFNLPAGLFVDSVGRLFAADSYNHRVQVFQLLQTH